MGSLVQAGKCRETYFVGFHILSGVSCGESPEMACKTDIYFAFFSGARLEWRPGDFHGYR
jgi:hypothetical protein